MQKQDYYFIVWQISTKSNPTILSERVTVWDPIAEKTRASKIFKLVKDCWAMLTKRLATELYWEAKHEFGPNLTSSKLLLVLTVFALWTIWNVRNHSLYSSLITFQSITIVAVSLSNQTSSSSARKQEHFIRWLFWNENECEPLQNCAFFVISIQ
jgi:hypothetical protein